MNLIVHIDANFVATESFIMNTTIGEIIIEEGEPMSLGIDTQGDLIYGSEGHLLKILHKTGLNDLLERVRPSTFTLKVEEDSETSLVASLMENVSSKEDILKSIPLLDHSMPDAIGIHSIRSMEK